VPTDYSIWYAFLARITSQDRMRLAEIERSHILEECLFVHDINNNNSTYNPFARAARDIMFNMQDPAGYIGDPVRHTIRAKFGSCIISSGEDPAGSYHQINNGGRRYWSAVHGEMPWQ